MSITTCRRYDRNHLAVTLRGIQKVTETRHKREADYHTLRMTKHVRSATLPFLCLACAAFCWPQIVASLGVSHLCCKFTLPSSVAARHVLSSLRRLKGTSISFRRVAVLRCCCPKLSIAPNLTSVAPISSTLLMPSPTFLSFCHFNFPSFATCFTA